MSYLKFKCSININDNPLNLEIDDYLDIALRNNEKRRFLFISKKLGKHLPVNPSKVDEIGYLLSKAYMLKFKDYYKEKQMIIGFAETATALAHSFFEYMTSGTFFIHTTREEVENMNKIEFKEEHSHSVEQNLYIDNLNRIRDIDTIILVDDEITTAKTCVNMIEKLNSIHQCKKYVVASILNWIDTKKKKEIEERAKDLNCSIEFVYIFNGTFNFELNNENQLIDKIEQRSITNDYDEIEINTIKLDFNEYLVNRHYLKYTGRFGIDRDEQEELKKIIKRESLKLNVSYKDEKILALGIEEFMYIPMMLSKEIEGDVYFHSITRSPIIPIEKNTYPIKKKYKLESFYNENVNYIYNLDDNNYKECFLFMEIDKCEEKVNEFIGILKSIGIKKVNIVRC